MKKKREDLSAAVLFPFALGLSKRSEEPFDKLRANGETELLLFAALAEATSAIDAGTCCGGHEKTWMFFPEPAWMYLRRPAAASCGGNRAGCVSQ